MFGKKELKCSRVVKELGSCLKIPLGSTSKCILKKNLLLIKVLSWTICAICIYPNTGIFSLRRYGRNMCVRFLRLVLVQSPAAGWLPHCTDKWKLQQIWATYSTVTINSWRICNPADLLGMHSETSAVGNVMVWKNTAAGFTLVWQWCLQLWCFQWSSGLSTRGNEGIVFISKTAFWREPYREFQDKEGAYFKDFRM